MYYVKKNRQALALTKLASQLRFQASPKNSKEKQVRIFAENLMPADVAQFLGELAREDKGIFDHIQLQRISDADEKLVCELLHIGPGELHEPGERIKLPNIIEGKDKPIASPPPVQPKMPQRPAVLLAKDDAVAIRNFIEQRRRSRRALCKSCL